MRDRPHVAKAALVLLAFGLLGALGACGGGDSRASEDLLAGGNALAEGLQLEAAGLPPGERGEHYGPVRLHVAGVAGDELTWRVWDGDLPDGLALASDGTLSGTPRSRGVSVFSVHVSDGERAGVATRAVAIDAFGLYASSGLTRGEAWSGRRVGLAAVGAAGFVEFRVLHTGSGGRFLHVDGAAGHAQWAPGTQGDDLTTDVLEARDTVSGRTHAVTIQVRPDPTAAQSAEFGTTDVWYVNTSGKNGRHAYASDFHAGLAAVGLRGRSPVSHDAVGRCVDLLTAQYVRLELLRALGRFYLRDQGPAKALPVSFPFDEPGAGYKKPRPGTFSSAAPGRYNVINVGDAGGAVLMGMAFLDGADNGLIENDSPDGAFRLGVFVDVLATYYRYYYRSSLTSLPVEAQDEEALHALLHGLPSPGGRTLILKRQCQAFARAMAVILAHEIGHSLGLEHAAPGATNALMGSTAPIEPWQTPRFSAGELARLRAALPGRGRGDVGSAQPESSMPTGGVTACTGTRCHLCPPDLGPRAKALLLRQHAAARVRASRSAPSRP